MADSTMRVSDMIISDEAESIFADFIYAGRKVSRSIHNENLYCDAMVEFERAKLRLVRLALHG